MKVACIFLDLHCLPRDRSEIITEIKEKLFHSVVSKFYIMFLFAFLGLVSEFTHLFHRYSMKGFSSSLNPLSPS